MDKTQGKRRKRRTPFFLPEKEEAADFHVGSSKLAG